MCYINAAAWWPEVPGLGSRPLMPSGQCPHLWSAKQARVLLLQVLVGKKILYAENLNSSGASRNNIEISYLATSSHTPADAVYVSW